mgnify:FL=1
MFSRRITFWFIPLGLVVLHTAGALWLAATLNLWIDEAYSAHTSGAGPWYAYEQARYFELQPPLYFVLLALWRTLGEGLFWGRLFSVCCATGFLLCAWIAVRQYVPRLAPGWVLAPLAISPFLLHSASDMRVYALLLCLSGAALVVFHRAFLAPDATLWAKAALVPLALAGLHTQYFFGFLLVAFAAGLLLRGVWRELFQYTGLMALTGILFLPQLLIVPEQVAQHTGGAAKADVGLFQIAAFLPRRIQYYLWPVHDDWSRYVRWPIFLVFWGVLLGCFLRGVRQWRSRDAWLLGATVVLGALLTGTMVAVTGRELMAQRHTAVWLLPATLSVYLVLAYGGGAQRTRLLAAWTIVATVLNIGVLADTYTPYARTGDYARVAEHLRTQVPPGAPVLVFNAEAGIALDWYYDGPMRVLPAPEDWQAYNLEEFVLRDTAPIARAVRTEDGDPADEVWLVNNVSPGERNYLGMDYNLERLLDYLEARYECLSTTRFFENEVRQYRRRTN